MKPDQAGRFDATELDDMVHGRVRLGIMAYLAGAGTADFISLKEHLRTTNGNLSVHLGKLEEAGYAVLERSLVAKRTRTTVRLTEAGRAALRNYVGRMAALVDELG